MNGAERKRCAPAACSSCPPRCAPAATARSSCEQGATTVSVGPDTLLEFPALEKRGAPIDRIVQPRGNAFYNIGKREGRKLRVETPYLVGVVKGTQFNVAAQDEATTISLFEGLLEVRAADDSRSRGSQGRRDRVAPARRQVDQRHQDGWRQGSAHRASPARRQHRRHGSGFAATARRSGDASTAACDSAPSRIWMLVLVAQQSAASAAVDVGASIAEVAALRDMAPPTVDTGAAVNVGRTPRSTCARRVNRSGRRGPGADARRGRDRSVTETVGGYRHQCRQRTRSRGCRRGGPRLPLDRPRSRPACRPRRGSHQREVGAGASTATTVGAPRPAMQPTQRDGHRRFGQRWPTRPWVPNAWTSATCRHRRWHRRRFDQGVDARVSIWAWISGVDVDTAITPRNGCRPTRTSPVTARLPTSVDLLDGLLRGAAGENDPLRSSSTAGG